MTAIATSVWLYWGCCVVAATAVIGRKRWAIGLLSAASGDRTKRTGFRLSVAICWSATILTALTYALLTRKFQMGSYQLRDLVTFSLLNGVLEQYMFVFWFLLGCHIARVSVPGKPAMAFAVGYLAYVVYSGLIHAMFWVVVLPAHQPVTFIMVVLLSITSFGWLWLFWRYRAMGWIIAMHIFMDILMIGHLHSTWFDRYQLL
jgi:chlorophyllide a hydrolase